MTGNDLPNWRELVEAIAAEVPGLLVIDDSTTRMNAESLIDEAGGPLGGGVIPDQGIEVYACLCFNRRPIQNLTLVSKSWEDAAMAFSAFVGFLNSKAPGLGWQPLFSFDPGICP